MAFKDVKQCLKSFPDDTQQKALEVLCDFMSNIVKSLNKEQCKAIVNRLNNIKPGFSDLVGILTLTKLEALEFNINRFKTKFKSRLNTFITDYEPGNLLKTLGGIFKQYTKEEKLLRRQQRSIQIENYLKMKTEAIKITSLGDTVVAIMHPLKDTKVFTFKPFSKDLDKFPYTPIVLGDDGDAYSDCGCQTEEQAITVLKELCFGTETVFMFIMEKDIIKHGWYLKWMED